LDMLYQLCSDKSKQRAKKDKAKQKAPFKDITGFIESGDTPEEKLSFKHQTFLFDTWAQIIQLNAFRDFLAQGLQTHFENNPLLHDVFHIEVNKQAKKVQLSQVEKRMFMSPSSPMSKVRTKNLAKQRNYKQHSLDVLPEADE